MSHITFHPDRVALLVLDMQRFFLEEGSHALVLEPEGTILAVNRAIGSFRKASRPVLFTRHGYGRDEDPGLMGRWWNDDIRLTEARSGIDPRVHRLDTDTTIIKDRYSAFHGTSLEKMLRDAGVRQVVICGVMTHLCVASTARDAFHRDLEVFVISDATSNCGYYTAMHRKDRNNIGELMEVRGSATHP